MSLFDVAIIGFGANAREPPEQALVRVFGIDEPLARRLVQSSPVVVKRAVPRELAEHYRAALQAIGAHVELRAATHSGASAPAASSRLALSLHPAAQRPEPTIARDDPGFDWSAALRAPAAPAHKRPAGQLPDDAFSALLPMPATLPGMAALLPQPASALAVPGSDPALAFARDAPLPWLTPAAVLGPSVAPPAPARVAALGRFDAAPGPALGAIDRELSDALRFELGMRPYGEHPLLLPLLLTACFALGWPARGSALGVALVLLLGLGATGTCLAYVALRARLAGSLARLGDTELPCVQHYLRAYQHFTTRHGFSVPTRYRNLGDRSLQAVYRHVREPAYFVVQLGRAGASWEFVSAYGDQQLLITSSEPLALPELAGCVHQCLTTHSLEQLFSRHGQRYAQLARPPYSDLPPYEALHDSLRERMREQLAAVLLWPLWLLPWRLRGWLLSRKP